MAGMKVDVRLPMQVFIGGRLLHPVTYALEASAVMPMQCRVIVAEHPCLHPETVELCRASVAEGDAKPDPQFWCRAFNTVLDHGRPMFVELEVTEVHWKARESAVKAS